MVKKGWQEVSDLCDGGNVEVLNFFGFDQKILDCAKEVEACCFEVFKNVDMIQEYNQQKVLAAFVKNKVTASDFSGSTGYGYDDAGRDKLDRVFADIFNAEDALVRHNFVSGTHAITVALFALLRPGDKLVSITGTPYDTLNQVIGIDSKEDRGSLKDFGVLYDQVELTQDGKFDEKLISQKCTDAKVVYIQRSRGYSLRPSISVSGIEKICSKIKNLKIKNSDQEPIVVVDNCYGEFVEIKEPVEVGADLIVGSLIKNPGGGVAKTGGYIAGKSKLIDLCAQRLTSPGIGKEVGCTFSELREMFLGLFLSSKVTCEALKTSIFAAGLFERLGYDVFPKLNEKRSDIIQVIKLGSEERIVGFCKGLQKCSPIDSFVSPLPWAMPGYDHKVIMAAGAFTMGSSIEISADAPMREPFAVWLQGGLTYSSGKLAVMSAANQILT